MELSGPLCSRMAQLVPYGPELSHLVLYGPTWSRMVPYGPVATIQYCMVQYGPL